MTTEQLQKAIALNKRINDFRQALQCFEQTSLSTEGNVEYVYDLTPRIILDVDDLDDGRTHIPLPMGLSNAFVDFMKEEIKRQLAAAEIEFNNL